MTNGRRLAALSAALLLGTSMTVQAQAPQDGDQRGGRPDFGRLLYAFDENQDQALEEKEVPEAVWARMSRADANKDGKVTRSEFDSYRPGRGK